MSVDVWDELLSRVMDVQQLMDAALAHVDAASLALMASGVPDEVTLAGECVGVADLLERAGAMVQDLDLPELRPAEHLAEAARLLNEIEPTDRPVWLGDAWAQLQVIRGTRRGLPV